MKKILMLFMAVNIVGASCTKDKRNALPACIQTRIEQIMKQDKWNPPAEINEYEFNGKTAYLISADCCDQYSLLVGSDCEYICAPDGGITGKGDKKCNDFYSKAKHVRLVWKDNR